MSEVSESLEALTPPAEPLVSRPKQVKIPAHGLIVFESRHAPGFVAELKDAYSKFTLVIAGRARVGIGGRTLLTLPNTLYHISAGTPHHMQDFANDPVSQFVIHYLPEILEPGLSRQLMERDLILLDLNSPKLNQTSAIRSLFREMLFEQDARQRGYTFVLRSRLIDMAVRTLRMEDRQMEKAPVFTPGSDSAERVANYAVQLLARFYRQETLESAARSVFLSRRQFSEVFRKVTGNSWRQYVQTLRLEHAARLLTTTDQSVIAISFEAGFEDLSHFYRSFKTVYHCSPMAYRTQGLSAAQNKAQPGRPVAKTGGKKPRSKRRPV